MNQTCTTGLLSRAALKDRAKGALSGRYGKYILAFLTATLITGASQYLIRCIVSVILQFTILTTQTIALDLTPQELLQLTETETFNEILMKWYIPVDYITLTITQFFTSVFRVGLTLVALNIACGQTASVSDIFCGFRNQFGKALKVSVVFVLIGQLTQLPATLIGNMTTDLQTDISMERLIPLLLILLICSIIYIVIYLGFSQVYFLFLDFPGYNAGQLIQQSFRIMKGHKKRLLLLELSFLPLLLLSLLTMGIGDLWLTPYMQLTYTFFFLNLMQARTSSQPITQAEI